MKYKIYHSISQCLTLQGALEKNGRHITEKDLGIINNASVVVDDKNTISWIGESSQLPEKYTGQSISCKNETWLPALVECHTHLIFGGNRYADYRKRCAGKTYAEVAQEGGGIISTINQTRNLSIQNLTDKALNDIRFFDKQGIGALEIKSGYGLTLESEITQLECVRALREKTSLALIPTFIPAHAVPPEYKGKSDAYVDLICAEWIPAIREKKLAVFFDAFIEEGYFTLKQAEKMGHAALENGFKLKFHSEQFNDLGATSLAIDLGATSCDHLEQTSDKTISKLASSSTVAVLAPGASLFTKTFTFHTT
jgi:imidazolonepropionase